MDIIKNPVVIGLITGAIAYYYMEYKSKNMDKDKKKKRRIRQLVISFIVAFIFWFIAYGYFDYSCSTIKVENKLKTSSNYSFVNANDQDYKFISESSSEPKSITLITNGITIPKSNLPDVTVDMF
jgi:Cu2+-containing amine oxidase